MYKKKSHKRYNNFFSCLQFVCDKFYYINFY